MRNRVEDSRSDVYETLQATDSIHLRELELIEKLQGYSMTLENTEYVDLLNGPLREGRQTLFYYVMTLNMPALAKWLIEQDDFNVNYGDKRGNTPLHFACLNENPTYYCTMLLCKDAVQKPNVFSDYPLHWAIKLVGERENSHELLHRLMTPHPECLENDDVVKDLLTLDSDKLNECLFSTFLIAGRAQLQRLRQLMKLKIKLGQLHTPSEYRNMAAENDLVEVLKWLNKTYPQTFSITEENFQQPMLLAIDKGRLRVVKWIWSAFSAARECFFVGNQQIDVLSRAVYSGQVGLVKWFSGLEQSPDDVQYRKAFDQALMGGQLQAAQLIWPRVQLEVEVNGLHSVYLAIDGGSLPVLKWLVDDINLSLDPRGISSIYTPLGYALCHGNVDILKWLVEEKTIPLGSQANPIALAVEYKQLSILKWLVEEKAIFVDFRSIKSLMAKQDEYPIKEYLLQHLLDGYMAGPRDDLAQLVAVLRVCKENSPMRLITLFNYYLDRFWDVFNKDERATFFFFYSDRFFFEANMKFGQCYLEKQDLNNAYDHFEAILFGHTSAGDNVLKACVKLLAILLVHAEDVTMGDSQFDGANALHKKAILAYPYLLRIKSSSEYRGYYKMYKRLCFIYLSDYDLGRDSPSRNKALLWNKRAIDLFKRFHGDDAQLSAIAFNQLFKVCQAQQRKWVDPPSQRVLSL